MKFLIDAHLPRRLVRILMEYGHEAIHTREFADGNRTDDAILMEYADAHSCSVTTKDADFVNAFYLQQTPRYLWLLSTGNISNPDLELLIRANLSDVVTLFATYRFVELSRTELIAHS